MRNSKRWLASALMVALVLVGAAAAQPPDPQQEPPRGLVQPARVSVDDTVERILSFDKDKDGKVTREELPERMHDLIARGDTNKDGALDKDEIKQLASTPSGFGPVRSIRFDAVGGPIRGAVDDLKLSGQKKDQALAVVKAHEENVRKLTDQARAEMLLKMKEVLSEEEFKDFKAALDRQAGFGERGVAFNFNVGPAGAPRPGEPEQRFIIGPAGPPRPGDVERRLDQLQKELDELRRQLRR